MSPPKNAVSVPRAVAFTSLGIVQLFLPTHAVVRMSCQNFAKLSAAVRFQAVRL